METKRIIPCMDIKNGRVVKGVNFEGIKEVADPVALAEFYNSQGADELVFYDITASIEGRGVFEELFCRVAEKVTIPLTLGGGIARLQDVERALELGANRVSINSGAIANPNLIKQVVCKLGSAPVILAVDVKKINGKYCLMTSGGMRDTGLDALDWVAKGEADGAGEVVVNSIDTDGVKQGFDLELLDAVASRVSIPIVASGGAGKKEDFLEVLKHKGISAGLAASVFHYKEILIPELKQYLADNGMPVYL